MGKINESELYAPVKEYLEDLGYEVKAEVRSCDITAVCGEELIVVELKTGFTLKLIYQAMERQRIADSVYVAVPLPKRGYLAPDYHDVVRLCKRLELGLIFVGFTTAGKAQIDVAVHPKPASAPRKNKKERMAVITEHNGRTGSVNTGGVARKKIITVYKEQALQLAELLKEKGELKSEDARKLSGIEKTSGILRRNYYGWYEMTDNTNGRYTYAVTNEGLKALEEYKELL